MRRLILMRHAKSDWDSPPATDHQRPLNARGRRQAPHVARTLAELNWVPDFTLSSSSTRTRETWTLMEAEFPHLAQVQFRDALYHAGWIELRTELQKVADEYGTILALGHNPGWQSVAHKLSGEWIEMKTATAVLLEFSGAHWSDASASNGAWNLAHVVRPVDD